MAIAYKYCVLVKGFVVCRSNYYVYAFSQFLIFYNLFHSDFVQFFENGIKIY